MHARGFRFCLHNKKLPGRPDIVLPKYGVAIMVNGCFWHGHKGCRHATKPKTNIEFWETKIVRNRHRDEVTTAHLEALGWTVMILVLPSGFLIPKIEMRCVAAIFDSRILLLHQTGIGVIS